jgi:hypothetical protein
MNFATILAERVMGQNGFPHFSGPFVQVFAAECRPRGPVAFSAKIEASFARERVRLVHLDL